MAIGLVASGIASLGKGILGSLTTKKDAQKQTQQQKQPKQKVDPDKVTGRKKDEPNDPTKAPRVKTMGASSPLLGKTGMTSIDKSLTNISQSIGNIKSTLYSKSKFDKERNENLKRSSLSAKRKRRESKAEAPIAIAGAIGKAIKKIPFFDKIKNYFLKVLLGAIVLAVLENIEFIKSELQRIGDEIKKAFDLLNENVIQPIWEAMKFIVGPITKTIAKIMGVPDEEADKNTIKENLTEITDIALPPVMKGIEDIGKMFLDFITGAEKKRPDLATPSTDTPSGTTTSDGPVSPMDVPPATSTTDVSGTQPTSLEAGGAIKTPDLANKAISAMGFSKTDFDVFKNVVAKIESGGKYDISGGSGNHYDGRYQLGADAKTDAARYLGVPDPGHGPGARERFRKDPQMQENFFAAFTQANHTYLMRNQQYKNSSPQRKLQILGYAHNQGMGGAEKWMTTGVVGADGFGTKGTKYTDAIRQAFSTRAQQKPQSPMDVAPARSTPIPTRATPVSPMDTPPVSTRGLTAQVPQINLQKIGAGSGPIGRTSERGMRGGRIHAGIDIGTSGQKGWYVAFKMKGRVSLVTSLSGYGKTVIINAGGYDFLFAHLASYNVKQGDQYNGQVIGEIGNTGVGTGEHLHFEVRRSGGATGSDVDPNPYVQYLEIGKLGPQTQGRVGQANLSPRSGPRPNGVDRQTQMDRGGTTTIIAPVERTRNTRGSGMRSRGGGSGGGGGNSNTYYIESARNKLYKQG